MIRFILIAVILYGFYSILPFEDNPIAAVVILIVSSPLWGSMVATALTAELSHGADYLPGDFFTARLITGLLAIGFAFGLMVYLISLSEPTNWIPLGITILIVLTLVGNGLNVKTIPDHFLVR